MTKILKINKGPEGWGGPLEIEITPDKKVLCVTGTGIHPLAKAIAEAAGVEVCDAFKNPVEDKNILVAVINCAGTLRCGVYPQKGVPAVNVNPIGPSGPLANCMNETNYVSGTTIDTIEIIENGVLTKKTMKLDETEKNDSDKVKKISEQDHSNDNFAMRLIQGIGLWVGKYTAMFYQSGKEAIDICISTVLPFMAFISVLVGIIMYTGIGTWIANILTPLSGNIWGLLLISIICGLPFLSPILGAGAAVAQVIGVLIGAEIGKGNIPVQYALPALFAINIQVGADFVPVGLSMQEATPDTIKYGVPAFLISRCITGPICVLFAFVLSFGMY